MRRLWHVGADGVGHGMVMRQRRRLSALRRTHVLRRGVWAASRHGGVTNALACLVRRVVEQGTNVVNEKRVEEFCDLLLVREIQRAVEGNPAELC